MAVNKTSLSAGEIIRAALIENAEVSSRAGKIYPIVEDKADLPYIVYRRASLDKMPVKDRRRNDTIIIEVQCYTADYTEGVELAEAVRNALDGVQIEHEGLVMRACDLTDSQEDWINDAYVQHLEFTCKM